MQAAAHQHAPMPMTAASFRLPHVPGLLPGDYLDVHAPCPRAVELREVDCLPRAEQEPAPFDDDGLRRPDERALDMGIRVPLAVAGSGVVMLSEGRCLPGDVVDHGRVGVLVYRDAGGRMRAVNEHDAVGHASRDYGLFDPSGYIHELAPLAGLHPSPGS